MSTSLSALLLRHQEAHLYDRGARQALQSRYLTECSTINLAFSREAFKVIGGFDEAFAYGSDVDFTWRLTELVIGSAAFLMLSYDMTGADGSANCAVPTSTARRACGSTGSTARG